MACRLFGANALPEPVWNFFQTEKKFKISSEKIAYMRRLVGAKPLSEPMVEYC